MNNLKEIRNANGSAIFAVTAKSGVSASLISAIENHDYKPRDETKERIAEALGVEVSRIWPSTPAVNK